MPEYKYDFNEVKKVADIEKILEHYDILSTLKTKGGERAGRCMLGKGKHGKKDSFTFNVEKKTFQCFSCKKRGSVIDFVRFHDGCTLPESAEKIMQIMEGKPRKKARKKKQEKKRATIHDKPLGGYGVSVSMSDDDILKKARDIMRARVNEKAIVDHMNIASEFLINDIGCEEREIFSVMFLNNHLRLIDYRQMFSGTVNEGTVYIREIAKVALELNATSIICAHNHPSSDLTPSSSDLILTKNIKKAFDMFDIKLTDHFIVGGGEALSMNQKGFL